MIKEEIKWVDFNGRERTGQFYFNITKSEILRQQLETGGIWAEKLNDISKSNDPKALMTIFEEFLDSTYGVKSEDGLRHVKNETELANFKATGAYDELYYKMCTDSKFALNFVNTVMPVEIREAAAKDAERIKAEQDVVEETVTPLPPVNIQPVLE